MEELRDKNGLTEKEFLANYTVKDYPRPSVTADICIFAREKGKVRLLMIKRGGHPCLGMWALPGGFSNPDETVDSAAARELEEETGVKNMHLEQLGLFSDPQRDPRTWVITCAFMAVTESSDLGEKANDDADDTAWFDVELTDERLTLSSPKAVISADLDIAETKTDFGTITHIDIKQNNGIAFDHAKIIASAILRLRERKVI